jgi:hypothetical protein
VFQRAEAAACAASAAEEKRQAAGLTDPSAVARLARQKAQRTQRAATAVAAKLLEMRLTPETIFLMTLKDLFNSIANILNQFNTITFFKLQDLRRLSKIRSNQPNQNKSNF